MNILFFINSLRGGGAEKVLVNLVNNLDSNKYNVTVLSLFNSGVNRQFLNPNIKYKSVFSFKIYGIKFLLKLFSPQLLHHLMIKHKYNIEVAYLQGITTRIISGGNDSQTKIAWIHGTFNKKFHSKSYRSVNEMANCYRRFNAIIGVSNDIAKLFSQEIGLSEMVTTVYNTLEIDEIINNSLNLIDFAMDKSCINFITVGSLIHVKGYERLLNCVLKLKVEGYKFHLYILGSGLLMNKLETFVNNNNLSECITFLGYQVNPHKYIRCADVFICSSFSEGFSGTVSEAIIVGTPVLTTKCSSMTEILGEHDEYGIIVENSEKGIYFGMKNVLENPEIVQYYKKKVKERRSFFSKEKTVKQAEDLFENFCNKQNIQ